jgi:pSer/pThr/pTyr-binding forkhead associated (FHA) protein
MKGAKRLAVQVTLTVVGGRHAGKIVPVTRHKFFIGRASDCHLRLSRDFISRHHCMILVGEDFAAVRDLGSRNGTRINGEELRGQQVLKSGDRLAVGHVEFEIHVTTAQGGKNKPELEREQALPMPTAAAASETAQDYVQPVDETCEIVPAEAHRKKTSSRTVVTKPPAARKDIGETVELPQDNSAEEMSEEEKEKQRKQRPIVGVSKSAQAKRATAGTRDAAAEALTKFFGK